jgi:hypothetical protein
MKPVAQPAVRLSAELKGEKRYDHDSEIRLMAEADGYVMVRKPGKMPFVRTRKEWDQLSRDPKTVLRGPVADMVRNWKPR